MNAQEALARLAALCDEQRPWDENDADSAEARSARAYNFALDQVRKVLADVTPEPGGVLDRDQAARLIDGALGFALHGPIDPDAPWMHALAACVRPAAGVTLTPAEAALAAQALRNVRTDVIVVPVETYLALADRLEASS